MSWAGCKNRADGVCGKREQGIHLPCYGSIETPSGVRTAQTNSSTSVSPVTFDVLATLFHLPSKVRGKNSFMAFPGLALHYLYYSLNPVYYAMITSILFLKEYQLLTLQSLIDMKVLIELI